jgi:hypothetical protein
MGSEQDGRNRPSFSALNNAPYVIGSMSSTTSYANDLSRESRLWVFVLKKSMDAIKFIAD